MRILLVEDDPASRVLLRKLLVQVVGPASIGEAETAEAALGLLARSSFDVVVTDLHMGSLDGIALLERVRAEHPRAGRVLVTGHASFEVAREAINRAGVHAFLQSP